MNESQPAQENHSGDEKTLFDAVTGDMVRIKRIRGGGPSGIRQRLLDMGVTRGTIVKVERHAPLGDPVEVEIKGYHLALRMSEAREIEVEDV
jgi:Fe2+ transport system protein FeoA